MSLQTYPLTAESGKRWQKFESYSGELNEKKGLSFLYIGHRENFSHPFSNFFQAGELAEDLTQAKQLFSRYDRKTVPDAIFIDLPLNKTEYRLFYHYILSKNIGGNTVIIYNERKLDLEKIKFLKRNELIDEVLDLDSQEINFSKKVNFLKKIKTRQSGLIVSRMDGIKERTESGLSYFLKRSIDIMLVSAAILVLLPVFLIIAFLIRLESKGEVIYTSKRAGKGFKVFNFYKFRTMEVDADKKIDQVAHLNQYDSKDGKMSFLKINNDPRITRTGKFLRKSSLDELPQLFNVLKGDMSLVGNRPLPLYEAYMLTTNDCVERFMAPAGMTGLWQIKKRGRENMSTEERINLDIAYARKNSIAYDLWIMANTPGALLQKSNV